MDVDISLYRVDVPLPVQIVYRTVAQFRTYRPYRAIMLAGCHPVNQGGYMGWLRAVRSGARFVTAPSTLHTPRGYARCNSDADSGWGPSSFHLQPVDAFVPYSNVWPHVNVQLLPLASRHTSAGMAAC
eukprot:366030-Chlamydomonas_euryale.AAC.16